jgi:ribosomal protein L44E
MATVRRWRKTTNDQPFSESSSRRSKNRKVKRLSPSFGGVARYNPRNIEKIWKNNILSYISKKANPISMRRGMNIGFACGKSVSSG